MPISFNTPIWIPVNTKPILYADFITHLNYLDCMCYYSRNLCLTSNKAINGIIPESRYVMKKVKLIELTLDNIREEYKKIQQFPDYSEICISWIPVKSYYLFFNLLLLLEYLIEANEMVFSDEHKKIKDRFSNYLRKSELIFNQVDLNKCYNVKTILSWVIPSGNNIRRSVPNYPLLFKQTIKKLLDYKKEDYKRIRNIKSLRGNNLINFLNSSLINACEFFYWYRIKANYRDMEFIDSGVPVNEFYDFYKNYYELTTNFYEVLKTLINNLSTVRLNKMLLTA